MNEQQKQELLGAIVDIRKRLADLETSRTKYEKLVAALERKVDAVSGIVEKLSRAIKQLTSRVGVVKERLSATESAIRRKKDK